MQISREGIRRCGTSAVAVRSYFRAEHVRAAGTGPRTKGGSMSESIYNVIELIGTSEKSWEEAAKNAVETAGKTLRDLRVAEIVKLDLKVEKNKVVAYRARVQVSFKYEGKE
jgi:hypothetical protein